MATVASPPRARQRHSAKAPAPPPVATPGPAQAPAPPPVAAKAPAPAGPAVRHGKMSIRIGIGGKGYRVNPAIAGPPIEGVVTITKEDGTGAYAVATDGLEIRCTCPDHERNGATCKHIMAVRRAAIIFAPFAVPAAPPAPETAPPVAAAAPARRPIANGFRRAVAAETSRINGKLAEGWQPGGRAPADDTSSSAHLCIYCGDPFDPEESRDPHLCTGCREEVSR